MRAGAAILLLAGVWGAGAVPAQADVVGSFGMTVAVWPTPCTDIALFSGVVLSNSPCESTVFLFDWQTELEVAFAADRLFAQIHTHAGTTGFEDILFVFVATLGDLRLKDTFVFAQPFGLATSPDGRKMPVCYENAVGAGTCELLFVKKRVEATLTIEGVTIHNLAILEDVNFPNPGRTKPSDATYSSGTQTFGFGSVLTLKGLTPGGIAVVTQTFLCAEEKGTRIKKHYWSVRVNPDCAAGALPPGFFDLEKLSLRSVPLAEGLAATWSVACRRSSALNCLFQSTLTLTKPDFPSVKITTTFEDVLGPLSFSRMTAQASGGPLSLTFWFDSTLQVKKIQAVVGVTLNPEANPATLRTSGTLKVGEGLTFLKTTLGIKRGGLTLSLITGWKGSAGNLHFSYLTARVSADLAVINVQANIKATPIGLSGNVQGTVRF